MTSPIEAMVDKACGLQPRELGKMRSRQQRQVEIMQRLYAAIERWYDDPSESEGLRAAWREVLAMDAECKSPESDVQTSSNTLHGPKDGGK